MKIVSGMNYRYCYHSKPGVRTVPGINFSCPYHKKKKKKKTDVNNISGMNYVICYHSKPSVRIVSVMNYS